MPVQGYTISPMPGLLAQCGFLLRAALQRVTAFADRRTERRETAADRAAIDRQAERLLDTSETAFCAMPTGATPRRCCRTRCCNS